MQNNIFELKLSEWAKELTLEIQKALNGKISISETDIIDGALFLMCILPAITYTNIESSLMKIAKEGNAFLTMEEESKVLQAFKCMYGLDESGRRRKYIKLIEDQAYEDQEAL